MPRYDVVVLQEGVGNADHHLIPQNAEEMAQFADHAARRARPIETILVDTGDNMGRIMDVYRDGDEYKALVKMLDMTHGMMTKLITITPEMVGEEPGTDLIQSLMPRLVSREVIPSRVFHRDQRVTGRYLDVWVNPNNPLQLMAMRVLDDTPNGLAMQRLIEGIPEEQVPVLGGESMEVDAFEGVWMDGPRGYLTGGTPTAVPRMSQSGQKVQVTEEMGAKGGSNYSFNTSLSNMSEVDMNTEQSAAQQMNNKPLDSGAEEHGVRQPKRHQNMAGDVTHEADEELNKKMQEEVQRAGARADLAEARVALAQLERNMDKSFVDLVNLFKDQKSSNPARQQRKDETLDFISKVAEGDADVVDMVIAKPDLLARQMDNFSVLVDAQADKEQALAQARIEAEEARLEAAKKQEKIKAHHRATAMGIINQAGSTALPTGNYGFGSFGSSSSTTTTSSSSAASSSEGSAGGIDEGRAERDRNLHVISRLQHGLVSVSTTGGQANYAFGGAQPQLHPRDERIIQRTNALMARGVPLDMIMPAALLGNKSSAKRGRTD
jgi:hypothetical protein